LAARGWRHRKDAAKLRDAVTRVAALTDSIDPSAETVSCEDVEMMLARVSMLEVDGQRGAAIDAARNTMALAVKISTCNDPRIPPVAELIAARLALDQPVRAQEAAQKIIEVLGERAEASPWWRRDRAIVAQALGRVGMREQGAEIARQLVAEARADPG